MDGWMHGYTYSSWWTTADNAHKAFAAVQYGQEPRYMLHEHLGTASMMTTPPAS